MAMTLRADRQSARAEPSAARADLSRWCDGLVEAARVGRAAPALVRTGRSVASDGWAPRDADEVRATLQRLGPLYCKIGQILAAQSGWLTAEAAARFRPLLADQTPMSAERTRAALASALPVATGAAFTRFDEVPVAAGSVAQVHRAWLSDGRPVAVKLLKHDARTRMRSAVDVVSRALDVGERVDARLRGLGFAGQFAELRDLLQGQCDLAVEADHQRAIAANFAQHPYVRVPRVHADLSGPDVLVMDYVDAPPGTEFRRAGQDPAELAARLQEICYTMTFAHGLFHVDPHPGNLRFGVDGTVHLLDFGLVDTLDEDDRWNLSGFFFARIHRDFDRAARRFEATFSAGPALPPVEAEWLAEAVGAVLRRHFQESSGTWSTMAFYSDAARLLQRVGRRVSRRLASLAVCLLTAEGFVSQIHPDVDLWHNARRFADRFTPHVSDDQARAHRELLRTGFPVTTAMRDDAADVLVAPTHYDRFVLPNGFPLVVARAHGCRLEDVDGRTYVDFSSGYGPHILGYAHPVAVAAGTQALARGAVNAVGHPAESALARLISEAFGPGAVTALTNSGTEAVITALRIARAATGRDVVAKCEGHYHGFSDVAMVSSWFRHRGRRERPEPVANSAGADPDVTASTIVLQYGEAAAVERIRTEGHRWAALVLEPMPAALAEYDIAFLRAVRQACDETGTLLVFDEVVSGFRVTYGGVQHLTGVAPDLTCLGKIIGGGLPCGAVVGRSDVMAFARTTGDPFEDVASRAFVGGTMSGNSVTAATGAAVLEHLRDHREIYVGLDESTRDLADALTAVSRRRDVAVDVRARHSIFSITFDRATPSYVRDRLSGSNVKANLALGYHMRSRGIYVPELHTLMLNAAHTPTDLEQFVAAYDDCLVQMSADGLFAP